MPEPGETLVSIVMPARLVAALDSALDAACEPVPEADGALLAHEAERVRTDTDLAVTSDARGRHHLALTRLPRQVDPDRFIRAVADAVREGELSGIADLTNLPPSGTRLVMTLKRDAPADDVSPAVLALLARCQREIIARATAIRAALRHQAPASDGPAAAVELTAEQWELVTAEIDRLLPEDDAQPITEPRPALLREALEVVHTALSGDRIEETTVATGRSQAGVDWAITVQGRTGDALVLLVPTHHGRPLGSGGLRLYDDDPPATSMRVMTSYHAGLPTFVMVFVDEAVDRFVITTTDDREQEIALSAPAFGRRFGADDLLAGEDIASMRTQTDGELVEERRSGRRRS